MAHVNTVTNAVILAFTAGLFAADYTYDSHWFNYLFEDASYLKSKVIASVRNDAATHYNAQVNNSQQHLYVLAGLQVIVLISLVGSIARGKNRPSNILTLLLVMAGWASHFLKTLPSLQVLGASFRAAPLAEATALRDVALGHVVCLVASILGAAFQIGNLEDDSSSVTEKKNK